MTAAPADATTPWRLGAAEIDMALGPRGLDPGGIHEIKPGPGIGDWSAALGFALRLAMLRLEPDPPRRAPLDRILWCATDRAAREIGRPHAAGLLRMGLDPGMLVMVEARRVADVLWAIEESLKSRSVRLVLALVDEIGSVPARRLSLAAEAGATPALLVTHPARPPTAAAATRWRVSARPSAPHPLDPRAPGAARFGLALERCRERPLETAAKPRVLEWSDETHRFRLAAGLADRAAAPPGLDEPFECPAGCKPERRTERHCATG